MDYFVNRKAAGFEALKMNEKPSQLEFLELNVLATRAAQLPTNSQTQLIYNNKYSNM